MKSTIAGPVAAMLVATAIAGGTAADTPPGGDPFAFVRPSIQVSPSEKRKIDRGEVLVKISRNDVRVALPIPHSRAENTVETRYRDLPRFS